VRPQLVVVPYRPQPEPDAPRCPTHHCLIRRSDAYCWAGGHTVPVDEWEHRDPQMSLLHEQRQERLVV
jgi:hypothetical protein